MLDDKTKLEQYFKDEIQRVSMIEINQIDSEIADIREQALQGLKMEAQADAGMEREQELKELLSEHAIHLSQIHESTNRKLMAKRKELSDKVFQEAQAKLDAFTRSNEYRDFLIQKAKSLTTYSFEEVVFYLREADRAYLQDVQVAYGKKCECKIDLNIQIGGLRMECSREGIVIDDTFDTALEEQKDWFYTNSGLFIK